MRSAVLGLILHRRRGALSQKALQKNGTVVHQHAQLEVFTDPSAGCVRAEVENRRVQSCFIFKYMKELPSGEHVPEGMSGVGFTMHYRPRCTSRRGLEMARDDSKVLGMIHCSARQ